MHLHPRMGTVAEQDAKLGNAISFSSKARRLENMFTAVRLKIVPAGDCPALKSANRVPLSQSVML